MRYTILKFNGKYNVDVCIKLTMKPRMLIRAPLVNNCLRLLGIKFGFEDSKSTVISNVLYSVYLPLSLNEHDLLNCTLVIQLYYCTISKQHLKVIASVLTPYN